MGLNALSYMMNQQQTMSMNSEMSHMGMQTNMSHASAYQNVKSNESSDDGMLAF